MHRLGCHLLGRVGAKMERYTYYKFFISFTTELNGSVNGLKPRIYTTNTQTPILITLITCSVFLGFFPYFYLPLFILSISFPLNQLNKNQLIIN